jgi:DNA-3-methyladenine glycosylase II
VPAAEAAAEQACAFLRTADPRLAALIERIGPFRPKITRDPFSALAGAIVHQQVSMSAAATIHRRIRALCPRGRMTARALLGCSDGALRQAGASRQKARYLRCLADAFTNGTLSARRLRACSDEEVIAAVTQLPGIGRWTAEMLLIFCLQRPDVWPIDDLGLRRGVQRLLGRAEPPDADTLRGLGEAWRPYRSYATWYLWRSLAGPREPAMAP